MAIAVGIDSFEDILEHIIGILESFRAELALARNELRGPHGDRFFSDPV